MNIDGKASVAKLNRLVTASFVTHSLMIGPHLDMAHFVEDECRNMENGCSRDTFMARQGEDGGARSQVHRFLHAHSHFKEVVTHGRARREH